MRIPTLLLISILLLYPGMSRNALSQESITGESGSMLVLSENKKKVSARIAIKTASDKVPGFNLLSNDPPVPDFEMHDEEGKPVTFASFRGKVVLFNLWATWCPPCIKEMPVLNSLQAQYQDRDFLVVPVASGRQGAEEPANFLRKQGLSELTTYYDPHSRFLRLFDLETLPITFLVDRDGTMRGGVIGMLDWSTAEAKDLIESFLDEKRT